MIAVTVLTPAAAATAAASGHTARALSEGSSPAWTVSMTTADPAMLVPGGPPVAIAFTITSHRDHATLRHITATIAADQVSGDIENGAGTPIPGCPARWFTLALQAGNPLPPVHLTYAGETYTGRISVGMSDLPVDQDACERHGPAITITASS